MCVHERELDIIGDLGFNGERDKMVIFIGYRNCQLGPATRVRASFKEETTKLCLFSIYNYFSIYYNYKNSGK